MKNIRQIFLRGILTLIPIIATIYVLYSLFKFLDKFLGAYISLLIGRSIPGVGIIAIFILIFIMGSVVTNVIGERLFIFAERMIRRIPIVPRVYFGLKQIVEAFSLQGKNVFNRVVLIEYPRKGLYVVGFLTGECKGEVQVKTDAKLMNVFVPTTPNPTSGMLILVPEKEIVYLDMTVEEGLKLIVSAGVVVPETTL
ncbi:MAG: hypothetical protein XD91_1854 [Clostridiales bacterium 38_11]|nr:MAG: hypothetical protein XD91_1854 [Clostridiales bacterium 38_11]